MAREIEVIAGIGIDKTVGSLWLGDEYLGNLEKYYPGHPLSGGIVGSSPFVNVNYYSGSEMLTACVDTRDREIYKGEGELFKAVEGVVLIKDLMSARSWGTKAGDKIVFFSYRETGVKRFAGPFIGYHDSLVKKITANSRQAFVIEARNQQKELIGILMFSSLGKVLFNGNCSGYRAGSKETFLVYTKKKCVKI